MRLVDDLAARRLLYSRPIATMPDLLVIDIPPAYAAPSLPLGRYYPVILETGEEYTEITAFLELDRAWPVVPDLFERRPSALFSDDVVVVRYAPSALGWPWLMLCRWPADYVAMVPPRGDYFARGAYTSEAFETIEELALAETRLRSTLGSHGSMRLISVPDIMGHA